MKKLIFAAIMLVIAFMTTGAHAQAAATSGNASVSATQALGTQNTQVLQQGLFILGMTLDRANAMLVNQPQNLAGINSNLNAIRNSLLAINSTIAILNDKARAFAAGTPGLPNTGGGGAATSVK